MEAEEPFERGFLAVTGVGHSTTVLSLPLLAKRRQPRYCMLFKASERGVERLELYDSKDDPVPSKIVALTSCVKIAPTGPRSVSIYGRGELHEVTASTEADALRWARALQTVAFGERETDTERDKENELYSFCGEGVFSVRLRPSEASERCGLEPADYRLAIGADALELRDADTDTLRASWPYRYVRRYGYRSGRFTFEAGRKCDTGEGAFHLEHSDHREIFRCVSLKLQSMKKRDAAETPVSDREPPPRPRPAKPPRKAVPPIEYDRVEVRSEAWKTLGIERPDHTELLRTEPEPPATVIRLPEVDGADYDRLQHFGSTSRLNRGDGYESVSTRATAVTPTDSPSSASRGIWSDYDVVENVFQSVRLADDAHVVGSGYGALRRPSEPGPQVPVKARPPTPHDDSLAYADVAHRSFDGSSYAIVSKPKRV